MTPSDSTEALPSVPAPLPVFGPVAVAPGQPVGRRQPPRRRGRGVALAVAGAVAIAALVGGSAYALQGSPSASYRSALVTRSSVVETLERSGTIEPVAQASVAFPMSGTVAGVSVTAGQTVFTGQPLAALNTTSLQAELTSKQATLAQAQLVVSQAVTTDATVVSDTTPVSSPTSTGSKSGAQTEATTSGASSGAKSQTDASTLQKATAVTEAQKQVDQSLQSATAAVQTATNTCSLTTPATGASGVSGLQASIQAKAAAAVAAAGARTSAGASTTVPAGTATAGAANATTCADAEQAALTDQQSLASAETNLAQAEAVLQGALTTSTSTATPTGTTPTSSPQKTATKASTSTAGTGNGGGTGNGNGSALGNSGSGSTSGVTSAAQLVADQAAVDADQAGVTAAQQSLAQATIVSPINGTVASVGLSVGQSVTADSSTDNVIVVGQGGWEVATTVPVGSIADVKVGDSATVLPDGFSSAVAGQVVQIGVAATTSGTTTVYPVTVGFNNSPSGMGNGASATVTIDMAMASQALTVPTSAVHSAGGFHYVTTLSKGTITNTPVQVGALGDDRTVVTSGLTLGQEVVLAVLNAPLPASNTAATTGRTGLTGATGLGAGTAVRLGGGTFTNRSPAAGAGG